MSSSDATVDAFRSAMAEHRVADAQALLAPDVVFHSPVVHRVYQGRDQLMAVLGAVSVVLEDFSYGTRYRAEDGGAVLAFSGRVGDRSVDGVDILTVGDDGLITELTVMMRPYSGLTAVRDAMAAQLAG